jgi:hypothetical protein
VPFIDSLDIANRTCQHLGATRIASPTEDSVNNSEISFAYDKLRRAELRRNTWRFAIKKAVLRPIDTTTFLLAPRLWNAGTQYLPGSVVKDTNGQLWVSNVANNIGNDPNLTDVWEGYYGSMTVDAYDSTGGTSYFAGDLVYQSSGDGSYIIYMSLQNSNTEVPYTPDEWDPTVIYKQDDVVTFTFNTVTSQWRSLIALNQGQEPGFTGLDATAQNWSAIQTYPSNATVVGSDGFLYSGNTDNNLGNDPVSDDGTNWSNEDTAVAWVALPAIPISSNIWVPLYASLVSFNFVYPLGVGPLSQTMTKNIFRLPAGYLRQAAQDPKAGINSYLGAPSGNMQNDWEFEGDFLISQCGTPIVFRFVADVMRVSEMDDLFCEGLAARIGVETCETITNSNAKQQTCNNAYQKFMGEARIVNAIENGSVEPPEDDYITCRR